MKFRYKKSTWLLFVLIMVFSSFMSFTALSESIEKLMQTFVLVMIGCYFFVHKFSLGQQSKPGLKSYVWMFLLIPWLSVIPAFATHGQTLLESAFVLTVETGIFLLYFLLLRLKVTEQQVINALTAFAFIYTFFEFYQQLTYPKFWFAAERSLKLPACLNCARVYINFT